MAIGDKLTELMAAHKTNTNQLAKATGVNVNTIYGIVRRNNTKVALDDLQSICDELGVGLDYFTDREQQKEKPIHKDDKSDVFGKYCQLSSKHRLMVDEIIGELHLLENQPKEEFVHVVKQNVFDFPYATEESTIELPMPNGKASAGLGNYIFGDDVETIKVIVNDITRKADFLMEVDGWSMSPKFDSGDIVAVRDVPDIALGEIGVFVLNNDRFIKQRGDDGLISLNPDYDDIDVNEYDEVICLGKVIAKIDPEHIVD